MKVLLIYEEIPENTMFFSIQDPSPAEIEVLETAHGHIINCKMSDEAQAACDTLSAMLGDGGCWLDSKVPVADLPKSGPYDKAYHTGFLI